MRKILISRTDNIGDVVLTLPMVGLLKSLTDSEIYFLGKSYTIDILKLTKNIDHIINYDDFDKADDSKLIDFFQKNQIDTIIHVFPNKKVARCAKKAGVKIRVGTSHRLFHLWTCNQLLHFSRKKSNDHEAILNLNLLKKIVHSPELQLKDLPKYYGIENISQKKSEKLKMIFHTKSFGSAVDWPIEKYVELSKKLIAHYGERVEIYFSGTAKESPLISPFIETIVDNKNVYDMTGKFNLSQFVDFISHSDFLLACSTGPLHIASAVGINSLGLYSNHRPIHSGRWAPVGVNAHYIDSQDLNSEKPDIARISVDDVFKKIKTILK